MNKSFNVKTLTMGGAIAALYVVLTWVSKLLGLDSHAIQLRLSEALTILPVFTFAAVPGLTLGCLLANITVGCMPGDVVLGTLATLLGAIGTRLLRKHVEIAWLPPVISNMLIVPFVLIYGYMIPDVSITIPFTKTTLAASGYVPIMITVGIGEVLACGWLGLLLHKTLQKTPDLKD